MLSVITILFPAGLCRMPKRSRSDANLENSDCGSTSDGASSDSDCSSSELRNLSETSRQRKRKLKRSRYLDGQSKGRYKSVEADSSPSEWNPNVCSRCSPVLQKYESTFKSLIHQGSNLRRRQHINPNPQRQAHYRDLNKQNEWLRNNIFDTLGNYLFCCKCVHSALGVSYQRLSRQRGIKRASSKEPIRRLTKAQVEAQGLGQYVLMPKEETLSFIRWWKSVSADQTVDVRYPHERHGLSGRVSHNAKTSVKDDFLQFIDSNSTPNGRSASSFGPTHYFSPKFTTIQTPKKGAKNFEQRVLTSIVGEFNRAQVDQERGTCSNYSASTWLKKHRPKHGIYPHKKDYCDTCAQLKADMKAKQTALNRIRQSGSATEHEQKELEASISTLENQLEEHKSEALSSQQNFNEAVSRCSQEWKIIEELEENGTDPDNLASHKHSFTLVISADYQMSKLIPHWGYSPQPGSTYYLQKLSHDIFGIVDHHENKSVVYTLH